MSKQVKSLLEKDLEKRLGGVDAVAVINPRGIDAIKTNKLRKLMAERGMKMTVVKNTMATRSSERLSIRGFEALLEGPSALVYGTPKTDGEATAISNVCRLLMEQKKDKSLAQVLELRGVFFDGEIYHGEKGVEKVSKFPTREEAISQVLSAVLGAGGSLMAAISGPGGSLGAILKSIEEKQRGGESAAA